MAEPKFCCDYAKRGTAGCKKCKAKCEKEALRIAKVVPNFFHDGEGKTTNVLSDRLAFLADIWFHNITDPSTWTVSRLNQG